MPLGMHIRHLPDSFAFSSLKSYCNFPVKEYHDGSGHICHIRWRLLLSPSFLYPHPVGPALQPANPGIPGKDAGLPSSAWITDGVRSCLFAGGIVIHVAGTEKPANYTPYRFGHSVSPSFAVYTSRHLLAVHIC
jgi:hypothetical protein